jgi:hypothetical protein
MSIAKPVGTRHGWKTAAPFVLVGLAAVIAGGLLSALTASAPTRQLAWLVAYLVLVVGVAQVGLGAGQAWLAGRPLGRGLLAGEFLGFTLGNAGVAAGTMLALPVLVDAGAVLLVASLALFLWGVRRPARGGWLRYLYSGLVIILLVSTPIGLVLAQVRAGR